MAILDSTSTAEIWKDIPGYEGVYQASDQGRVKRIAGGSNNAKPGHILSLVLRKGGYWSVHLSMNGQKYKMSVHRAIALAFIGNIPAGMQVNHINGDKSDNRVRNLEIVTPLENVRHAERTGLRNTKGSGNSAAKLSEYDVIAIRYFYSMSFPSIELARMYGVGQSAIQRIVNGSHWSHVNE